jgi:hypothetical protein
VGASVRGLAQLKGFMSSLDFGFGNDRIFQRRRPSADGVSFVAPVAPPPNVLAELPEGVESLAFRAAGRPRSRFQPLPPPTGDAPYRISLESVLAQDDMDRIRSSGKLIFHTAGDTGGINSDQFQIGVVAHMEEDCRRPNPQDRPVFMFHLGDVVYFKGEAEHYFHQFYEAYEHYPPPVFAIAGNHDGEYNGDVPSLDAFMRNFCAAQAGRSDDAQNVVRDTMTQPNVYFTLQTPLATVIGLYSNVPEGGEIRDDQARWFRSELRAAPADRALFLAVHHPLFSADDHHSGSRHVLQIVEDAIEQADRAPDVILTGHVHNYQRFTWETRGRQIPVVVAGGGGYPNLHKVVRIDGRPIVPPYRAADSDATLEAYTDNRHGFLRLEVTRQRVTGEYYAISSEEQDRADRTDRFVLDLTDHQLLA